MDTEQMDTEQIDNIFSEYGHGSLPRLPLHRNPGIEIVYLRKGNLTWQCEGSQEEITPESVYFTLPWQQHGSTAEYESAHKWHFVVIKLPPPPPGVDDLFSFPEILGFTPDEADRMYEILLKPTQHAWPASPMLAALLPALVAELQSPGPFHATRVREITSQLIIELCLTISGPSPAASRYQQHAGSISALLKQLDKHFDDPWTLDSMASLAQLKRTQFNAVFHHFSGDAPMTYLNRLRVSKARTMLRSTSKDITSIAFQCGFTSSQYFANVFRRFTGTTALRYRKYGPPELTLPRIQSQDD